MRGHLLLIVLAAAGAYTGCKPASAQIHRPSKGVDADSVLVVFDSDAGCSFVAERIRSGCHVLVSDTVTGDSYFLVSTQTSTGGRLIRCPAQITRCGRVVDCECNHTAAPQP